VCAQYGDLGLLQILRVIDRDWNLLHYKMTPDWRHDGHDNNWLLLEFALSLPFAIGFKTEAVSRALAFTMIAEAVTCWNYLASWPTWLVSQSLLSHLIFC